MSLLSVAARTVADWVKLGFPEEVAKRIVSGELPMDKASRMKRAEEQGYDVETPLYHGTSADINELRATGETTGARSAKDSVWLADSPEVAASYARYAAEDKPINRILEQADMHGRLRNFDLQEELYRKAEELESSGELVNAGGQNIVQAYAKTKNPILKDVDGATMSDLDDSQLFNWLQEGREAGNDGLIIDNFSDNADWGQYIPARHVAVQPEQVRSVNAAFDPQYKGANILGNADPRLLAGIAAGGGGVSAATALSNKLASAQAVKERGNIRAPNSGMLHSITMGARDLERRLEGHPAALLFPEGVVKYLEQLNREERPNRETVLWALLDMI